MSPAVRDAILGSWVGIAFVVWVTVQVSRIVSKVCAWLKTAQTPRTHVDATINQMYGDVRIEPKAEPEYAGTRNARQQLQRRKD